MKTKNQIVDEFNQLQEKYDKLKKLHDAKQYFLDDAIEMMTAIKNCMLEIVNAIKLHKFSIEDGKNIDDCNAKLWQVLDKEEIQEW